ncbi:MAG: hypothetical protein RR450_09740, partial [Oscillospiraceae bacterium]
PPLRPKLPDWKSGEDRHLSYMLVARMLFSALVDADYSSSAEHDEPDYLKTHTGPALDAAAALESLKALRAKKQKNAKGVPPGCSHSPPLPEPGKPCHCLPLPLHTPKSGISAASYCCCRFWR